MTHVSRIVCVCGESVPVNETEKVWLQTGQGMTAAYAHPGCVERLIGRMGELWHGAERIEEPKSKEERALEERTDKARKAEYEEMADRLL